MKLIFLIFIVSSFSFSAKAVDIFDIIKETKPSSGYAEKRNQRISIKNLKSPLDYSKQEKLKSNNLLENLISNSISNKFQLGTGILDVTLQVKDGVKFALKDSFKGYPDYQRRVQAEEFVNSNINSHQQIEDFLSSQKHKSLISLAQRISKQSSLRRLEQICKKSSYAILYLIILCNVFYKILKQEKQIIKLIQEPLAISLLASIAIKYSSQISNSILKLGNSLEQSLSQYLGGFNLFDFGFTNSLEQNWSELVNNIGYMPAMTLSIIDIIAQFVFIFFLATLLIHIVLGKIFFPIFIAFSPSSKLSQISSTTLIFWLKSLVLISLLPLSKNIIDRLSLELTSFEENFAFLNIAMSIVSLLALPTISLIIFKLEPKP